MYYSTRIVAPGAAANLIAPNNTTNQAALADYYTTVSYDTDQPLVGHTAVIVYLLSLHMHHTEEKNSRAGMD